MAISMRPSTFTEGGGLLDDVDVIVKEAAFCKFDYNGQVNPAIPALYLSVTDRNGADHDQYFAAGNWSDFTASEDGKKESDQGPYLVKNPKGQKEGVNASSNFGLFIASLVNCGFPEDKLDSADARVFIGLDCHLTRRTVKRGGLVRTGKNAERGYTVLEVTKIHKLPWEAGGAKPAAVKASSTPKANGSAQPAAPSDDLAAKAQETVIGILAEQGGSVPKAKIAALAHKALGGDPDRAAIVNMVFKDAFLTSGPWQYADGVITMG